MLWQEEYEFGNCLDGCAEMPECVKLDCYKYSLRLMAKERGSSTVIHGWTRERCSELYIVARPIFTDLGSRNISQMGARNGLEALQDGNSLLTDWNTEQAKF